MGDSDSQQPMYPTRLFEVRNASSEVLRYDHIICNGTKICTVLFEPEKGVHRTTVRSIESASNDSEGEQAIDLENMPSEVYQQIYQPSRDSPQASALVDVGSEGSLLRIGQSLYQADSQGEFKRFSTLSKDVSLSISDVAKRGSQIIVTSRERVTEKSYSHFIKVVKPKTAEKTQLPTDTTAETSKSKDLNQGATTQTETVAAEKKHSAPKKPQAMDSDVDADSEPNDSGSEVNSDGTDDFSAAESWSEGSSESEDERLAEDAAPLYTSAFRELEEAPKDTAEAEADSGTSSASSDTEESAAESEDDRLLSYERRYDWESDRGKGLFNRDRPSDSEDDQSDAPDGFWSDYDGKHEDDSDGSDEDVDGLKRKMKKAATKQLKSEPVAQLHVLDTSKSDNPQIFHFARRYKESIGNSRPAAHPSKPLVVWPIGDHLVLFADTKHNTYFYRKLRASQPGSTQVSVESHFSANGKYLHMATLEQRPAKAPPKNSTGPTDPSYDLLVSTYRLSLRKTTRSPPVLTYRVKLGLGQLPKSDLAFQWFNDEVIVSCCAKRLTVFRVRLFRAQHKSELPVLVPRETIELPDSSAERVVSFSKLDTGTYVVVMLAPEPGADKKKDSDKKDASESGDDKEKMKEAESTKGSAEAEPGSKAKTTVEEEAKTKDDKTTDEEKDKEATKEKPRVVLIKDHPKDTYAVFLSEEEDLGGWIAPGLDTALQIKQDAGIGHFEQEAVEVDQDSDCC